MPEVRAGLRQEESRAAEVRAGFGGPRLIIPNGEADLNRIRRSVSGAIGLPWSEPCQTNDQERRISCASPFGDEKGKTGVGGEGICYCATRLRSRSLDLEIQGQRGGVKSFSLWRGAVARVWRDEFSSNSQRISFNSVVVVGCASRSLRSREPRSAASSHRSARERGAV